VSNSLKVSGAELRETLHDTGISCSDRLFASVRGLPTLGHRNRTNWSKKRGLQWESIFLVRKCDIIHYKSTYMQQRKLERIYSYNKTN